VNEDRSPKIAMELKSNGKRPSSFFLVKLQDQEKQEYSRLSSLIMHTVKTCKISDFSGGMFTTQ
jgi:hypothetical protein